ncbi:MAG: hypothetical protein JWO76_2413 [Nocardioides sp.]|nr:hypothetical protein [Nocardioides sp.]
MSVPRAAAVVIGGVLVPGLIVGCAGGGQQVSTESGTTVLLAPQAEGGMDAITRGTVEVVGSCLGVRLGTELSVVVWPSDASTTGDSVEIDGQRVAVGDFFQGSGGYLTAPYPEDFPDVQQECLDAASSDELMWVQSLTKVTPKR